MAQVGDEYITTSDAASELGITRQRVLQLIEAGKLKATKFANVYMIHKSALSSVENRRPGRPPKVKKAIKNVINESQADQLQTYRPSVRKK